MKREIGKYCQLTENKNIFPNKQDATIAGLRSKFIALCAYTGKEQQSQNNGSR